MAFHTGAQERNGDASPNVLAPLAVADGTVFVTGDAEATWQFALDATDGSVRWQRRLAGERERFVPAVGPEAVSAAGAEGELLALDRETGAVQWTRRFEARLERSAVVGDRLCVTTEGVLHALSRDGDTEFTVPTGVSAWNVAVGSERLYVTDSTSTLAAFDAETGEDRWETGGIDEPGKPVVDDSTVYVGGVDFQGDGGPQPALYAFDKGSGDRTWRFETRSLRGEDDRPYFGTREQVAVGDGTLYFTTRAGDLYAVGDR